LKRLKVTPTSPTVILAVQVLVYVLYSIVSLILVYAAAAIFFGYKLEGSWIQFIGAYLLVLLSIFSIGILVGGVASNIKIAGVLASVLYFPMLVLSGATLPYEVMPTSLQRVADIMPLTQGIKLLKSTSLGVPVTDIWLPTLAMSLLAIVCITLSIRFFKWE
jgi:ABC-2 type transport system permease protein